MAHICQESRLQAIQFFCLFTLLFSFFQFRDIVIHTDHFQFIRIIRLRVTHHIYAYPLPTGIRLDTQFLADTGCLPSLNPVKEVHHHFTVFRMHGAIYTNNLLQRRAILFPQILIPLADGISFACQQIEFGISYFRIMTNQGEEIFKLLNTVISDHLIRIIQINE